MAELTAKRAPESENWHLQGLRGCDVSASVGPDAEVIEGTLREIREEIRDGPGEPCPFCGFEP